SRRDLKRSIQKASKIPIIAPPRFATKLTTKSRLFKKATTPCRAAPTSCQFGRAHATIIIPSYARLKACVVCDGSHHRLKRATLSVLSRCSAGHNACGELALLSRCNTHTDTDHASELTLAFAASRLIEDIRPDRMSAVVHVLCSLTMFPLQP